MKDPILYIIQGFIGSGKSTFSRVLADQERIVRLNADEWCSENYPPEHLAANWNTCFMDAVNYLWKTAKNLLAQKQSVVFDMGFWDRQSRIDAREIALEMNARLVHYYIYAPDEILMKRLSKRSGLIAQINLKNFARLKEAFHEPEPHEGAIKIDNY